MKMKFVVLLVIAFSILWISVSAEAETITKPFTFVDGTPAYASEVNSNFDTVYHQVNKIGSEIIVDDINGVVGIGTSSPTVTLDVNGNIKGFQNIEVESEQESSVFRATSYDNYFKHSIFTGRRARGTIDSPSSVLTNDILASFGGTGYGSTGWPSTLPKSRGRMSIWAAEDWTDTAQGAYIIFDTTPIGTTTRTERMRITDEGFVGIGTSDPTATLDVVVDNTGKAATIKATGYRDTPGRPGGTFSGRKARGTMSSPSAVQAGDVLAHFNGQGYGETGWSGSDTPETGGDDSRARMRFATSEDWTDSAQGAYISFFTTQNGSTLISEKMRITDSGNVGIGTSAPQSAFQVIGYAQLDLTAGAPPAADCDQWEEHGRMLVDDNAGLLYICVASGWVAK